MSRPSPTHADAWSGRDFLAQISGPASRFPPIRVLFLAHRTGSTGRLRYRARGDERVIELHGGGIVGATGFPNLLSALGLPSSEVDGLGAQIAEAVARGTSPDRALDAAAQGLGVALARFVAQGEDPVRFELGAAPSQAPTALSMTIPRILTVGLRGARSADVVRRELGRHRNGALRAVLPDDAPESQWGLSPVAFRLLRDASRAATLGELLGAARGGENDETWQSVDLLLQLGLLDLDRGAHAPPPLGEAEKARLAELNAEVARLKKATAVEIFEITASAKATEPAVERAFRALSAKFHPDKMMGEPEVLREAAATCFALVNEARERILAEPEVLKELFERLKAGEEGRVYVSARDKMTAEMAFKAAEFALRKKDFAEAWEKAAEAGRLNPTDWRPGWIAAQVGSKVGKMSLAESVEQLTSLKVKDPKIKAEGWFQAGELLLAQGKNAEATAHFTKAVELDAEHIGARRHLRLKEMRDRPQANEPAGGAFSMGSLKSLFSFGKKEEPAPPAKGKGKP